MLDLNMSLDGTIKKTKITPEGPTCLTYTGFHGGLEHLILETRLIDKRFANVMGECDLESIGVPSLFKLIL